MPRLLSILAGRCHRFLSSHALTVLLALGVLGAGSPALAHMQDNFNRADAAAVGNGWIEKTDGAFAIAGNTATKLAVGTGYRDNLVYRPASENVLDVEASAEVTFTGAPGYAQIAVRVQTGTVANADTFDGYLLYVDNSTTQLIVGRQNGTAFVTTLANINLTTALNTTDRFRFRLAARNTNPVLVDAYVERLVGSIWETIGQANVSDASAQRIATAGSVGFGGYVESTYAFDNFTRVDLGATGTTNPAPTTVGLSPTQANAGESGLTLTVYGTGFTTDSVVRWNGASRTTTYVSPSELEATVGAADLASPGTANVTVFNPTPGGGTSAAQTFTIVNPAAVPPSISSLSPNAATAGGAAFTLTVNGAGFNNGSVVRWNGANRTTTFVSATQLTAAITQADIATAGTAAVTVLRVSDGQASGASNFTIDPPPPGIDFSDAFTRADNANVGNGWIEKTAAAFSLVSNEVSKSGAGFDYRDNLVYRPANENALDVQASVELRFTSTNVGYPQLFVRGQTNTIGNAGTMDAYLLYVNSSTTQAVLARQRGSNYDTQLATFGFSSALNTTDRFRMRLSASGTNPVALAAFVERWNGSAWTVIGQTTFNDADGTRISTAGTVGFGGYTETTYRLDNFTRSGAGGGGSSNPMPAISGLAPSSATAGGGPFTLTVNGSNFVAGSVVRWNGSDRTTTFTSATQLQAAISAADIAAQGTASVTVFNPAPGGGTSGASTFSITTTTTNPVPVASSLAPSSAAAGGSNFTLTVNGSNFVNGSVVRWNGANRTTTFVSGTQLTAAITAADIAAQGSATVTVFNPTPGGGTSGNLTFTINAANNPVPAITSLSPSSASAGSPGFTLTVNGSNFVGGSVVRWNGSNRATTFVSATQLTASISAGDIASQGNRTVTVFNPTPGGGTSNNSTFTVGAPPSNNPVPVLTSTTPTSWPTGGSAFTLVVNGSSFTTQSVVHWNGSERSTTVVSANELRASINPADVAAAGLASITVVTPAPGGGRSVPTTFFIQDGAISYTYDHFNRANSATVGNNWTEKNPDAFSIQNNEVPSVSTPNGFTMDIMHRPLNDQRLDMEVSTEFTRLASIPNEFQANWPQVHARVQTSTVGLPWSLDSYIFFFDDSASVPRAAFAVTRALPNPGDRMECYIAGVPLPSQPQVGARYRLRFRVSGTSPVILQGWVDQYSNGAWTLWASGQTQHTNATQRDPNLYCDAAGMPPPITNPGISGLAKWINRTDTYDNFYVRDLAPLAPPPTVNSINPTSATAGGPQFTLTVNGSGFQPGASVRWNGAGRTTSFVSSTQLTATITAADIASAGTATVTVMNNGSAESTPRTFTINEASGSTTFSDTFDRQDNAALGNGWIEKAPAAWSLTANRVDKIATPSGDYRNNIVYRPAAEDARDVEAVMEFRPEAAAIGYPSILARVQQATANTNNGFDGYMLFMDSSNTLAVIARQRADGNWETRLNQFNLSNALQVGQTYRMRLRTVGTTSVQVTGTIEQLINGSWTVLGTASANDASAQRIANPGAVGFTGYVEDAYNFDNFSRSNLN